MTSHQLLISWIYTPMGIMCTLLACWGVNRLIALGSISFPASVALLISLFVALNLCEIGFGERAIRRIVHVIDLPLGFALRFINVFFTPSFVLLPLSPYVVSKNHPSACGKAFGTVGTTDLRFDIRMRLKSPRSLVSSYSGL